MRLVRNLRMFSGSPRLLLLSEMQILIFSAGQFSKGRVAKFESGKWTLPSVWQIELPKRLSVIFRVEEKRGS